jgi:phosphatidylinositol glycan class P protein
MCVGAFNMEQPGGSIRTATSGFVAWALTLIGLICYAVWSGPGFHAFGLTYYPDRYWAIAAPALFVALFWYYLTTYTLMYFRNTKRLDDLHALTDVDAKGTTATLGSLSDVSSSVPPISDIPVDMSSKILHEVWTSS